MAMAEYAWASFNANAKVYEKAPQDTHRFHPTQKPVDLYSWVLSLFGEKGMTVLDTHAGSASSLVACHRSGYRFIGTEIDAEYYKEALERLNAERAQMTIFDFLKEGT